jgi:hypothetical protein
MVHPITRAHLDLYCAARGYRPSPIYRSVARLFDKRAPSAVRRVVEVAFRWCLHFKRRLGLPLALR